MTEKVSAPMTDPTTYLDVQDCVRIENAAESLRDRLLVALLWRSGLRVSEALNIRGSDIIREGDIKDSYILITRGKGMRKRRAFYDHTVAKYLSLHAETGGEDFLFPSYSKSGHLTRQRAWKIVKKLCEKSGVVVDKGNHPVHPHTFRHSLAIFLVKSGVKLSKIQSILGHTSISSTGFYLQFSSKEIAEDYHKAFDKVNEK